MSARRALRRLHVWLGWLVGIPLLFWTLSGLVMVARPIETVRGSDLRADRSTLTLPPNITAPLVAVPLKTLAIEPQGEGAIWVATFGDRARRADLATGRWLPPVSLAEARVLAAATYRPASPIVALVRTAAEHPPIDLRKPRPAWQATFADGTHLYIDADTGQVLALRTRWWRAFDWMWGLHIMDLQTREDTSHPLLIGFAALAMGTVVLALVLLPLAGRRRRGKKSA